MAAFLPRLAEHTAVLMPLTMKEAEKTFLEWGDTQQQAFDGIKAIVLSKQCLTTIDHENPGEQEVFVTCNASEKGTGAILTFGATWETARLVAFNSMQLTACQKNYPVHEKELLAIIRALTKWRYDLLGTKFKIYTDHRTLEHFMTQKDFSLRQARWQEYLAQYEFEIVYVKGEENTVMDALSRIESPTTYTMIIPIFSVTADNKLLDEIRAGYEKDKWCCHDLTYPLSQILTYRSHAPIPRA
jgi:hypothetical protein